MAHFAILLNPHMVEQKLYQRERKFLLESSQAYLVVLKLQEIANQFEKLIASRVLKHFTLSLSPDKNKKDIRLNHEIIISHIQALKAALETQLQEFC